MDDSDFLLDDDGDYVDDSFIVPSDEDEDEDEDLLDEDSSLSSFGGVGRVMLEIQTALDAKCSGTERVALVLVCEDGRRHSHGEVLGDVEV